ncbi:uncharacterized protein LOC111015596 [Momordica charantia]|uniref:Uncharacterized protein LOC111015596 n=1 Tax=Momordica charantia TaxID=3673 RepID=A0A6J1CYE3_MOMCH|nr:uncharacterized protein LOC111015596 [Momordica charantia]
MASSRSTCKALVVAAGFLILVAFIHPATAAGECGKMTIGTAAYSPISCTGAVADVKAKVSPECCSRVAAMLKATPKCFCAILLFPKTRKQGVNPAIGLTIPKRCNIKNRPAGKKCGNHFL